MALTLSNFAQAKDDEKPQVVPVTVEPISTKEFVATLNEVGKITAIDFAELTFSTPGKLVAINFKDGDVVKKGQIIAKLDSSKVKADLDKASSSLTTAKNKVRRVIELNKKQPGALSKQDFEELQDAANLAAADYRQQQAILKDYSLTAPFDGELTNFTKSKGSMIDAVTPLVSVYNLDPVEVTYTISQNDLGKAVKGQPITVTVEAYKDMTFNGVVDYVAPAVNKNTGRVAIHARIENPDHVLAPGMFAQVSQMVNGRTNRIVAPQNAILAHNEDRYVWVVDKNNVATKRYLTLGKNLNNGYVIVEKGLKVDDIVVVTGHQKIDDETLVNIIKTQASTADAPAQEPKKKTTDPAKAGKEETKPVKEQSNEAT
ncbi:efflux RND transporter periplasmic adaptor subunit [Photobacterium angustum]|uniref:Efflux RND transporter periplasmic adaptor subunit n=2 Tax=Photobacterium angustum TaxID=661 RepID=A0A855SBZ5_PHOAN|nr:efflux RND transporter periplasmic adaptor subunit [Photobacterium angustum]PSW89824.1 efflux RND transporter periplasmic adaptor subunit [Photobacterium angustum]PSW95544.1 efflux RND transporter periplasmic adaptor subunit [Photobacterium angustum]PSX04250.1 efflux RND transporter periplasmic adaptor subunit [Photobacterium angustum]PSX07369.1 efflux RND transporter periplasmic adaptor subunit [Photobacterium angustum]